jgi:hypothetical protein
VSGVLGSDVGADDPLMHAGLDSLGAAELKNTIEARTGVEPPVKAMLTTPLQLTCRAPARVLTKLSSAFLCDVLRAAAAVCAAASSLAHRPSPSTHSSTPSCHGVRVACQGDVSA